MEPLSPAIIALLCSGMLLLGSAALMLRGVRRRRDDARLAGLVSRSAVMAAGGEPGPKLVRGWRSAGQAIRSHAFLSEADARDLARIAKASGVAPKRALAAFTTAKLLLTIGLPPLAYVAAKLAAPSFVYAAGGVGLLVGLLLPNWVLGNFRQRYVRGMQRGLAEALDLMVVCSEAGLGLESAVDRVAREVAKSHQIVGMEFATFAHELRMLPDRRQAMTRLSERADSDEMKRLTATLNQTMQYGTPLAQAMRTLAGDLRRTRMQRLEERAAKLPALLILPMILFIMPCLFVVLVGPAVINISRFLGGG